LSVECSEFLVAESCGSCCQFEMVSTRKTAIVTGASQGIGASLVRVFLDRGYNVVANSRTITSSGAFNVSDRLALVDGSIAEAATAVKVAQAARGSFGSIDALVNSAGMLISNHFTDYTIDDLRSLVSVNIEGFFFISQLAIKQMLVQKTGGSIVNITSTMVDHPIAGVNATVAPGVVNTPMHRDDPKELLTARQPMGQIVQVRHRGRDHLSDRSRSGDGRSVARGRGCARREAVTRGDCR
jgi:short chain dehydrogenase